MKMQISEVAKRTGVSVRTLRYYDNIGLLKPVKVDKNKGNFVLGKRTGKGKLTKADGTVCEGRFYNGKSV